MFALGMVSAVSTMIVLRDAAEPSGSAVGFNEQMAAAAPAFAVMGVGLTAAAAGILVTAVQRRPDLSASRAD